MLINSGDGSDKRPHIGIVELNAGEPELVTALGGDVAWHSTSQSLPSALMETPVETVVFHVRFQDSRDLVDTVAQVQSMKPDAKILLAASSTKSLWIAEIKTLVSTAIAQRDGLSQRERQVLDAIREGKTNREIASTLGISLSTVNRHVEHILHKKAARNRAQAAAE